MDELGEFLVQILRWSKAGAIIAAVAAILGLIDYFDDAKHPVDASVSSPVAEPPAASKPSPSAEAPQVSSAQADLDRAQQIEMEQAAATAAAAEAARTQSPVSPAGWQPEGRSATEPPVVEVEQACAPDPAIGVRIRPKHRWPRRFFGGIGHGFKAMGHGFAKVGKAIVGR
jgi:hypothetical protein